MIAASTRSKGRAVTEALERRLVAVMFTDMVGYTALLQADERLGIEKRQRYVDALERHHAAHGGTGGAAARRRNHEQVPERAGCGAGGGRGSAGARARGRQIVPRSRPVARASAEGHYDASF